MGLYHIFVMLIEMCDYKGSDDDCNANDIRRPSLIGY